MQKIDSETSLRNAILQLENKRADEATMLKEQFYLAVDSIRPINLIKSTFKEAAASQDLKIDILNTFVGLTVGYLSKILFQSVTKSPYSKILGTTLMYGITKVVAKNPETFKSLGIGLLNTILHIFKSMGESMRHKKRKAPRNV
jgi:hypothetical protein